MQAKMPSLYTDHHFARVEARLTARRLDEGSRIPSFRRTEYIVEFPTFSVNCNVNCLIQYKWQYKVVDKIPYSRNTRNFMSPAREETGRLRDR